MTCSIRQPGAFEPFTLDTVTWAQVPVWYHVYCTKKHPTLPDTFAQGWGDTRFAPISTGSGSPVHTYYAASTAECAYMESVLHEIPLSPPGVLDVSELQYYNLAQVTMPDPLTFVSFHTPYLPQLGLTRSELIDSLPACYPETQPWAEAAYQQQPKAQAVGYGSRRDDAARCLMLFGQRLSLRPSLLLTLRADRKSWRWCGDLGSAKSKPFDISRNRTDFLRQSGSVSNGCSHEDTRLS